MIKHLTGKVDLQIQVWDDETGLALAPERNARSGAGSIAIIDSLLVEEGRKVRPLRADEGFNILILLVHYLSLLDPKRADSWGRAEQRRFLRVFDGFVVTSDFAKAGLESIGVATRGIGVIRPGLASSYRGPARPATRPHSPRLLTVANFSPVKGLMELVSVLEEIADLEWTWEVVGDSFLDPDYSGRLRRRIRLSSISEHVFIRGALKGEALLRLYDMSDIFVLPSLFENSPLVIQDAMARGLPIVAYAVGGIPEIVSVPDAGYLIDPGSREMFSQALAQLIENPRERRAKGRAAREASEQFHMWCDAGRQFLCFLNEMTKRHPTAVTV